MNEALAVSHLPTLDIIRRRDMWSGAHNVDKFINLVNSAGPGWVNSWEQTNGQWLNYPLMVDGKLFETNALRCPFTARLLLTHKDRINVAGFSMIKPFGKIPTHTDATTGIQFGSLAYHLGLDVPNDAATLIVNGKVTKQMYGKQIVFDSTFPHSAENNSNRPRTILYIDFKVY